MATNADDYWSIDIPGLTREEAVDLRERLTPKFDHGVIVTSPRNFMSRNFDRSSVELLAHCLRAGLSAAGLVDEDEAGVLSMLEDCEQWLARATD